MKKAYLILENGTVFEGYSFGYEQNAVGELVFTTGMCGYIETLTDPSYYGQIVMQTFPLIGNYGIIEPDFEGECHIKGYIVREYCDTPSNFRCQYTLERFLKDRKIPALCGVDTREITKIIREKGVMNASVSFELPDTLNEVKNYKIKGAVKAVSIKSTVLHRKETDKYLVALIDYGAKKNIIRELEKRDCGVCVFPSDSDADDILSINPDGIMLSNGPGDPAENIHEINVIKELMGKKVLFGICLGHQLAALAQGGKTEKLKYGHRGVNQPAKHIKTQRTYITSQNHGYAVLTDTLPEKAEISFVNANDGTCEGIDYPELKAFTVQFHPEACAGPQDTSFLFDKFIAMMEEQNNAD